MEIIRPVKEGLSIDKVRWRSSQFWANGKQPDPINARVEKVITGKIFKELWPHGRMLAPANGWFEWVKDSNDQKKKQPHFIRLPLTECAGRISGDQLRALYGMGSVTGNRIHHYPDTRC